MHAATVFLRGLPHQNAPGLKFMQAVCQYVGSNAFTGPLELAKGAIAAHHDIANDE